MNIRKSLQRGLLVLALSLPAFAGDPNLAPVPPMGWNSWDSYGRALTEAQFKANARWMKQHLSRYGWKYVVIDEGWYVQDPNRDPKDYLFELSSEGRYLPVAARWPSSARQAGFRPLADYVHSLGLKFGIHIIRGIPREAVAGNLPIADSPYHAAEAADTSDACPWNAYNWGVKNNPAGQAYYDSILKLYASWNVDFIKADCIADHPYKPEEIRMLHDAILKSGRPMVLSLSPGPTALEHAEEVAKYAEMWRICDDFWDHWGPWEKHEWSQSLYQQFATTAKWASRVKPGNWPDADMLPLGHLGPSPGAGESRETRLTRDEQRTVMTLWVMLRSPLIMGGDLPSSDKWTESLLNNPEVIAVDQNSSENRAVVNTSTSAVWIARAAPKAYYLGIFNVGDSDQAMSYAWKDLGLSAGTYELRDLWERKNLEDAGELKVTLKPHASVLYRITVK
ncbi:MAG TPA: glycoside hydrolase family 27 protein [Terriglobales bacterium]